MDEVLDVVLLDYDDNDPEKPMMEASNEEFLDLESNGSDNDHYDEPSSSCPHTHLLPTLIPTVHQHRANECVW